MNRTEFASSAKVSAILSVAVGILMMLSFPVSADAERWSQLRQSYFGDALIVEGDSVISLEAPTRAHDAATVPVKVIAMDPGVIIKEVYLFVDQNPLPLAGIFRFTEEAGDWKSLETRIRINEYTHVRAVGLLSNGELHMTERFVKAAGGCSAPAMADLDAAMARAGKMQLLLEEVYSANDAPSSTAVIKISHPNNSGMQFDQISRNYIPAFYVNTIKAQVDGVDLMSVETNFSMSENPVIRLAFNSELDASTLKVLAIDSKGNHYEKTTKATIR